MDTPAEAVAEATRPAVVEVIPRAVVVRGQVAALRVRAADQAALRARAVVPVARQEIALAPRLAIAAAPARMA